MFMLFNSFLKHAFYAKQVTLGSAFASYSPDILPNLKQYNNGGTKLGGFWQYHTA